MIEMIAVHLMQGTEGTSKFTEEMLAWTRL